MIVSSRHRPLANDSWSELAVRTAIEEIAADAIARFDPDTFWPGHPSGEREEDGDPSFYKGAAGVIWALDYLIASALSASPGIFALCCRGCWSGRSSISKPVRRPNMRNMARCSVATWVRRFSPCGWRPHLEWLIWCTSK